MLRFALVAALVVLPRLACAADGKMSVTTLVWEKVK